MEIHDGPIKVTVFLERRNFYRSGDNLFVCGNAERLVALSLGPPSVALVFGKGAPNIVMQPGKGFVLIARSALVPPYDFTLPLWHSDELELYDLGLGPYTRSIVEMTHAALVPP